MSEEKKSPEFSAEHLAFLGVESIDEAKSVLASVKEAREKEVESELSSLGSALSEAQKKAITGLFGESKQDQLAAVKFLRELGFIQEKPKQTVVSKLPVHATPAPSNALVEYERLKKENPIRARAFFLANQKSILSGGQ